jgi:hypothetical protein
LCEQFRIVVISKAEHMRVGVISLYWFVYYRKILNLTNIANWKLSDAVIRRFINSFCTSCLFRRREVRPIGGHTAAGVAKAVWADFAPVVLYEINVNPIVQSVPIRNVSRFDHYA